MKAMKINNQSGVALLPLVIAVPFMIVIATYFMDLAIASFKLAKRDQMHTHAQLTTDAGIDYALDQLNQNTNWTGTGSEIQLHNDGQVRTTYEVTVTTNSSESKTLTAIGRTYRPVGALSPESSVTIEVEVRSITTGGSFSLVTGVGGLYMENSAKIVGGDVLVNGEINMKNSAQIGLTTNPIEDIQVAHQNCPLGGGAGYPQLCGPGNGQPITLENEAHIYGDVRANNQTNSAGMTLNGLVAGSGVTPGALPTHDRAAQVAAAVADSNASCDHGETRTWAANRKFDGDVTVKGNCQVTMQGDVWITGKLTIENTAQIIVDEAIGDITNTEDLPTIMVDGQSVILKNSALLKSNSFGTGIQIITYWSKASCSPNCADVTGADLYDSRDETTIELDNSASGPQSIFYARWTRVAIQNSGNIGALVGQTVLLKNSGTITFGTSAGGGGGSTWIVDGYRRIFN